MNPATEPGSERVLVLAPTGGDAEMIRGRLAAAGMSPAVCADLEGLLSALAEGAGAVVVAQEAFDREGAATLLAALEAQDPWSDVPILLLTLPLSRRAPHAHPAIEIFAHANVTLLQRPLGVPLFLNSVRAALRARRRQYQMRDLHGELAHEIRLSDLFVGILGHDLRTPLGAIKLSAGSLVRATRDERVVRNADRIGSAADRMTRMIEQLLDFARARQGRGMALRPGPGDLATICREVVGELEAAHPGARIELRAGGELGGVWDADRLAQVVSNLVGNALQHGAAGRPVTVVLDGDRETVSLRVENAGAIAADVLPTLFDAFKQGDRGPGATRGVGLGLFIAREIVRAHGGELEVRSSADRTVFEASLPREPRGAVPTGSAGSILSPAASIRRDATDGPLPSRPEAEAPFRAVFEQAAVGMGRVGFADARWLDVNEAFCRMLGRSREELLATPWPEITHPDDLDLDLVPFRRMAAGELDSYSVEKRFLHGQGHHVWARLTLSVVRDAAGRPDYEIAIIEDITGRKRAEEALRESEARFRQLADAMPQVVWTARADGTVDYFNERVHELSGARRREDGSWEWDAVLHPDDQGPTVEAWTRAVRTGTTYEMAHRIRRSDGTLHWYLSRGAPVRDATGAVVRWYGTATDIDAQKRAEEALRDEDRRKNEFLGALSHELRNPLSPILTSLPILDRAPPGSGPAQRARRVIERQARHLARIVDDLLDVTRITRGRIELRRERVDLAELTRTTGEDHRDRFEAAGLALEVRAPPGPLPVEGDPTRLVQVIGNLLGNAVKFTPRGGRTVLSIGPGPEGQAVLRVRDDGVGMTADTLAHLFEPFAQGAQALDRRQGGLGLGLATVQGLVELHGGTVEARSDGPGRGSEFVVRLPLVVSSAASSSEAEDGHAPGTRRVLVIEDNVDVAESLRDVLALGGHEIAVAHTGPDGVALAPSFQPDVVLCDIGLPGFDGYEVARRLRAEGEPGAPYLVALSGYAQPEDLRRAREAGFDRHLAKPPDLEALEVLLAETPARPAP